MTFTKLRIKNIEVRNIAGEVSSLVVVSLNTETLIEVWPTFWAVGTSAWTKKEKKIYSSVSVWRGTEGGGVDAHRKRHLEEEHLTPSNKGEGAYGCCLDLMTCSAEH